MRNRHRYLTPLLLAVALLVWVPACGDDDDDDTSSSDTTIAAREFPTGSAMAGFQEAGKITVGTKFDQPLFGLKDPRSGEVQGFDAEIAKLIAERIGPDVTVEFVETPSAIRETALENGTVDMVVATYTINDTRKQKVDFAGPYYVAGQDIMVKVDDDSINGIDDLNGKRVCSVQGSTSIANVRQMAPQAQITEYDVYSKCSDDLRNGRVDAVSTDNVILIGQIDQYGSDQFKLVGNPFTTEPYGIGLPKGDSELRSFVNDVLDEIFANGEWAAAYERTVGSVGPETPEPPMVNRY